MTFSQLKTTLSQSPRRLGLLLALAGGLLISADPIFIRLSGTKGVDTAFLFGLFTAISMSTLIQVREERGLIGTLRQSGWPVLVSGLLILGSAGTFVLSIKHTAVANTMVIMSARPVFTAAASWLLLREAPSRALWSAMLIVVGGMAVVASGSMESGHLLGDGLALLTVTFLGLNGAWMRGHPRISRTAIVGLGGFFLALVMSFAAEPGGYSASTWLVMAAMGLASAPLGRVLNATSTRYLPAAEAALISLSNAVFAPLWVFLLFREVPPVNTLWGGAVIFVALGAYLGLGMRRKRPSGMVAPSATHN